MAIYKRASSALVLAGVLLAGCAMEGNDGIFTTGSLTGATADQGRSGVRDLGFPHPGAAQGRHP